MKLIYLYLFLLLLSSFIYAKDFVWEKNILALNDSNFDLAIKKYDNLFVLFYLPYNSECKKFLTEYEKSSNILSKENIIFSKIDMNTENVLSKKYDIKEYPRVLLFIKGKKNEYTGGMKSNDFIKWTRNKINKQIIKLNTSEEIDKFKKENDVILIYYGNNKIDIDEFTKAAKNNEDIPFAIVESDKLIQKYSKRGNLALYKKSENKIVEIMEIKEQNINDLINIHSKTSFMKFDEKSAEIILSKSVPAMILYTSKNSDSWDKYEKLVKYISIKIKGRLLCIIANFKDRISSKFAEYLGLKEYNLPSVVIVEAKGTLKKYKMEKEITEKNILNFIHNWENNKIKQYYKSAIEPNNNNNGNIIEIVGDNFNDNVINNNKDVVILFYTQKCLHCKLMLPKYEKTAKIIKGINKNIIFGKINMAENEIESEDIISFPCIKFYKGLQKDKKGIEYKGDRSVEDLIKFIKENCNNNFDRKEKNDDL